MQLRIITNNVQITQSSADEDEWIFKILKPKDGKDWFSLRASMAYIVDEYENSAVSITYI